MKHSTYIPYTRGLSGGLENTCAPIGTKAVMKPQHTLQQLLVRGKQKTPGEKNKVWYVAQVPCKDYNKVYIGETKGVLKA